MKKLNKDSLIKLGIKEELVNKLDKKQLEYILSYTLDHYKHPNLTQSLIQLISMEFRNKKGALLLANLGASVPQLKSLTPQDVIKLVEDYNFHNDTKTILKSLKRILVLNQQEKLFTKSYGLKGEYHIIKEIFNDDEEDYA
jgi:hypothetical protein